MNKSKKINYIVIERDGNDAEVDVSKVLCSKEEAVEIMKQIIDDEPQELPNGNLISEIECDYETMITSSYVWFIPVENLKDIKVSSFYKVR